MSEVKTIQTTQVNMDIDHVIIDESDNGLDDEILTPELFYICEGDARQAAVKRLDNKIIELNRIDYDKLSELLKTTTDKKLIESYTEKMNNLEIKDRVYVSPHPPVGFEIKHMIKHSKFLKVTYEAALETGKGLTPETAVVINGVSYRTMKMFSEYTTMYENKELGDYRDFKCVIDVPCLEKNLPKKTLQFILKHTGIDESKVVYTEETDSKAYDAKYLKSIKNIMIPILNGLGFLGSEDITLRDDDEPRKYDSKLVKKTAAEKAALYYRCDLLRAVVIFYGTIMMMLEKKYPGWRTQELNPPKVEGENPNKLPNGAKFDLYTEEEKRAQKIIDDEDDKFDEEYKVTSKSSKNNTDTKDSTVATLNDSSDTKLNSTPINVD